MLSNVGILLVICSLCKGIPPPLRNIAIHQDGESNQEIKNSPSWRLPGHITPSSYHLTIGPFDFTEEARGTVEGRVRIMINVEQTEDADKYPQSTIFINQAGILIIDVQVEKSPDGTELNCPFEINELNQFLSINCPEPLVVGEYAVTLEFITTIPNDSTVGLYSSSYLSGSERRYLVATDFEPIDARKAWPCFDEPQMKAKWTIEIIRPVNYNSLSNMGPPTTEDFGEGYKIDRYPETSSLLSTYLVALAVSDFLPKKNPDHEFGKDVTIWGPPPLMNEGGGDYSADISVRMINALQSYYGMDYHYPKMDKISLPDFASGAMENWGLNTYRETRLLYVPDLTRARDKFAMTLTISHELVHQWFGNTVTMKWWDDLWLNEGFASYYETIGVRDILEDEKGIDITDMLPVETFVTENTQIALQEDVLPTSHPIHYTAIEGDKLNVRFSRIVYQKAGSVLRMVDNAIGEVAMKNVLSTYLTQFEHKNAEQADLFQIMEAEEAGLQKTMESWTNFQGFPLIEAVLNDETGEIHLTQSKFEANLVEPVTKDQEHIWEIPIFEQYPETPQPESIKWMKAKEMTITPAVAGHWYILNRKQLAFARINYDENNWNNIISALKEDHTVFEMETRSGLIDDALNLAYEGKLSIAVALDLIGYMKQETDYVPWHTLFSNLRRMNTLLNHDGSNELLKRFVSELMEATIDRIGLEPTENEHFTHYTLLRTQVHEWACSLGNEKCIEDAKAKYGAWRDDGWKDQSKAVFPDLRPQIFCTSVTDDADLWNNLFLASHNRERDTNRVEMLTALTCTAKEENIDILIDNVVSGQHIASEDHSVVIRALAGSAHSQYVYGRVKSLVSDENTSLSPSLFAQAISSLSSLFKTQEELDDLTNFVEANKELLKDVMESLDLSKWKINRNIKWMETNADAIQAYLEKHFEPPTPTTPTTTTPTTTTPTTTTTTTTTSTTTTKATGSPNHATSNVLFSVVLLASTAAVLLL